MEEVGLIVLGSIVGALATGGVQAWDSWRRRKAERRVAARVILGDLIVLEEACAVILQGGIWPDRVDVREAFELMGKTWVEVRAAFAEGATALEWTRVDTVYNNLTRTAPGAEMGVRCTKADLDSLRKLHGLVNPAQVIALRYAMPKREAAGVQKELEARSEL